MHELFNTGPALCMLIKPSLAEPSMAQLGMMTEDVLQPIAFFPFHEGVLREGDFQIVNAASPVITAPEAPAKPIAAPPPVMPRPVLDEDPEPEPRGRSPLIATFLAMAAAILLGAFIAWLRAPHSPVPVQQPAASVIVPQNPSPVQNPVQNNAVLLNVKREDGTATLSWNRDASAVKNADYALLLIADGRHQEQLRLNKSDLETGRVVYIPRDGDLNFRLQLFAQNQSTTESVRSVADHLPAAPATHPLARIEQPQPVPAPRVYVAPETAPAPPRTASQPSVPQPVATQAAPPLELAKVPEAPKPTPFVEPEKATPKPREPEVQTTVSLELIGHSGIKEVFDTLSPRHIFGSGGDKTTPPRITRQILPGIFPAMASRFHGTREVDVKITIGAGGQVVKIDLVDGRAADQIDSAVYYAARQWTFEPARVGNRPVESKVLMHFVLKRAS